MRVKALVTWVLSAGTVSARVSDDVYSLASQIGDALDNAKSAVQGWSKKDGLFAALPIQKSLAPVSPLAEQFSSALPDQAIDSSEVVHYLNTLGSLSWSIAQMLQTISDKAQDFSAVGAGDIVGKNIDSLSGLTFGIISKAGAALPPTVRATEAMVMSHMVLGISHAFLTAASAFGLTLENSAVLSTLATKG